MEPPRETRLESIRSALGVLFLVVLVIASLGVMLWHFGRGEAFDTTAIELCRQDYQRARTATDSAMVGERVPILSRGQATAAVSCGTLRAAGRLR